MELYFWCRRCEVHIIRFKDEGMNSRCNQCHGRMQVISEEEFDQATYQTDDED